MLIPLNMVRIGFVPVLLGSGVTPLVFVAQVQYVVVLQTQRFVDLDISEQGTGQVPR